MNGNPEIGSTPLNQQHNASPIEKTELAIGYHISRLIGGGWQIAAGHSMPPRAEKETLDHMMALFDSGVTTFDCGDIYTGVEEMYGKFLAKLRKERGNAVADSVKIHTKFVPDIDALPTMDKAYVERIIDRSLQRLGTKKLDLVQFHWWDFSVPGYVETARYLRELQAAGKIDNIGLTNFDVARAKEILDNGVSIVSNQIQYSLLDRRAEHGMTALAEQKDFKLLCYGTLAGGFLSERYLDAPEPKQPFENRSLVKYNLIIKECGGWNQFQEMLRGIKVVAVRHGARIEDIAMRYILDKPQVASAIVGMSPRYDASMHANAFDIALSKADLVDIEQALGKLRSLPGDIYALERDENTEHYAIMKRNLNN